jgi:hypothetical protein
MTPTPFIATPFIRLSATPFILPFILIGVSDNRKQRTYR